VIGFRRYSACSFVFCINMATVIGPTPPGTGVMNPAARFASSNATSPTILFFPFAPLPSNTLMPQSMTTAPGLIQSPARKRSKSDQKMHTLTFDHFSTSNGNDQNISQTTHAWQILSFRVTNCDSGVVIQKIIGGWFSNDFTASNDDDVLAADVVLKSTAIVDS
jgi:hypothetical protein